LREEATESRNIREMSYGFPPIAPGGYGQEEDIRRAYAAGFAAHLAKPASREAVVEAVESLAAGK
jgi:DNA-binding NarL/FixJ family response regulator